MFYAGTVTYLSPHFICTRCNKK